MGFSFVAILNNFFHFKLPSICLSFHKWKNAPWCSCYKWFCSRMHPSSRKTALSSHLMMVNSYAFAHLDNPHVAYWLAGRLTIHTTEWAVMWVQVQHITTRFPLPAVENSSLNMQLPHLIHLIKSMLKNAVPVHFSCTFEVTPTWDRRLLQAQPD